MPRKGIQRCECGHSAFWWVHHAETKSIVACKACLTWKWTTSRRRHWLDHMPQKIKAAADAVLEAIVDKLPKTADGVPVVPWVDRVFWTGGHPSNTDEPLIVREKGHVSHGGDGILFSDGTPILVSDCYSTKAAAQAGKG